MLNQKGFLLVTMEPSPADEQEFHDWYDTEHVPEREAVPGVLTAGRYVCLNGWPRYVGIYDLAHVGVLQEPAYQAISGTRFSPWSKRILGRVRGLYRIEGVQVHPGDRLMGARGRPARLALIRFRGLSEGELPSVTRGLDATYGGRPELLQYRVFQSRPHGGPAGMDDYLALVELRASAVTPELNFLGFGKAAEHIDTFNVYAPYFAREAIPGVFGS